ncbi:hypothetical protein SDC9_169213 [bioreactor metagenome]|uniref:Uncharacterized protein n=1 Tax=bioreactor metagenome TaxID=1076179 RepID=A0A645G4N6_9ZZZZ
MSDVLSFFLWYLVISALGWIAFPLAFRFFPKLASKGYAVSKPLGLLVWGYIFWLLCTLGVLQNDLGGQFLALLLLVGISVLALLKGKAAEFTGWIKENWKSLVTIEAVFLVFFVFWQWCAQLTRRSPLLKNQWNWPSSIPFCVPTLFLHKTRGFLVTLFLTTTLAMC